MVMLTPEGNRKVGDLELTKLRRHTHLLTTLAGKRNHGLTAIVQ